MIITSRTRWFRNYESLIYNYWIAGLSQCEKTLTHLTSSLIGWVPSIMVKIMNFETIHIGLIILCYWYSSALVALFQHGPRTAIWTSSWVTLLTMETAKGCQYYPESKVHGANMGPICVLSAADGPHVGPMNLAIRVCQLMHWLLNSSLPQQTWYWLCRREYMYCCSRVNSIYLGLDKSKILFKMWVYLSWSFK